MNAKTYDKKTAAFVGFMIQNVPDGLTGDIMQGWMNNPSAMKRFLSGLVPPEKEEESQIFSIIETINLGAVPGKKTARCFKSILYAHRDSDFDNWLGKNQPDAAPCEVSVCTAGKEGWTFAEAACALPGVKQTSDTAALGRSLIINGYTVTLSQIEDLVESTERGEKTGLRTDGYGNFFFVETDNEYYPVLVGLVRRNVCDWNANLDRLGADYRWHAVDRILVRNLDASKLAA